MNTTPMKELEVDVAIIGAGTAGMGAYRGARFYTDKIALIEGGLYGTTCARVGCMPSKLLISAAEAVHAIHDAPTFGIDVPCEPVIDGKRVMERVRFERDRFVGFVVESVEEWDAKHRVMGYARFIDDHTLQVDDHTLVKAKTIVIGTGSRTNIPSIFESLGDLLITNDDVFYWEDLPDSVAVFGGGVIGIELGQSLHRLGVRTRLFGRGGGVGPISDPKVLEQASDIFNREFSFLTDANVKKVDKVDGQVEITFVLDGEEVTERFQYLLAATGRVPNTDKIGLENTSLARDELGVPFFDRYTGQAGDSNIFIAGDANNDLPLLHEAADEGRVVGDNAGRYPDVRCQPRRTPMSVVFSDPQIMQAGQTYEQLTAKKIDFAVGEVDFKGQGRSRVMNKNAGLLRVYAQMGTGLLLGAEMIGPRAENIAHLVAWAVQQGMSISEMLRLPFYHPVVEEGLRTALRDVNAKLRIGAEPVPRCLDCGPGS